MVGNGEEEGGRRGAAAAATAKVKTKQQQQQQQKKPGLLKAKENSRPNGWLMGRVVRNKVRTWQALFRLDGKPADLGTNANTLTPDITISLLLLLFYC